MTKAAEAVFCVFGVWQKEMAMLSAKASAVHKACSIVCVVLQGFMRVENRNQLPAQSFFAEAVTIYKNDRKRYYEILSTENTGAEQAKSIKKQRRKSTYQPERTLKKDKVHTASTWPEVKGTVPNHL